MSWRVLPSREFSADRRARRLRAARRRSCLRRRRPRVPVRPRRTTSAGHQLASAIARSATTTRRPDRTDPRPAMRSARRSEAADRHDPPVWQSGHPELRPPGCHRPDGRPRLRPWIEDVGARERSRSDASRMTNRRRRGRGRPASGTASWTYRCVGIGAAAVHRPVRGSKISALARTVPAPTEVELPPATRTRPSSRRVAVW